MQKKSISKTFLWFSCLFCLFFSFFQVWGAENAQSPQTKKKIEQVGKDIQELQQSLSKLQKKLEKIDPSLAFLPPSSEEKKEENLKKIETTSILALQYFGKIKENLKERLKEFLQGLKSIKEIPQTFYNHKGVFQHYFLGFVLSISIGIFCVFGSGYFLRHWMLETLLSLKERNIAAATIVAILSCVTALPLIGYFLLSLILSTIFQSIGLFSLIQGTPLAGNFYATGDFY